MNKNCRFVITQDKEIANKLISEGLRPITNINGTYTFENKPSVQLKFSEIDKKKLAYTNILSL